MIEAIAPVVIIGLFAAMLVLERVAPGRALPTVRGWYLRGAIFFVVTLAINALIPAALTAALGQRSLFHLRGLGTLGGAIAAFLVGDLLNYWLHRGLHNSHIVWRWTHQMHHSAERVDMLGAAYLHPLDTLVQVGPGWVAAAALGVSPEAAALAGLIAFFWGTFQHVNVRTPRWLGYVIQRPEAHTVHHQRGVHAYNYGNVPVWDIAFGTFRNPEGFAGEAGFYEGASNRVGEMLTGRDVAEPRLEAAPATA